MKPVVVIPSKDNAPTVAEVARACLRHCPDVVVVDDGSTDGTGDAARAVEGVTVLVHPVNQGKGVALATALHWAGEHGYTHMIALDADGQHDPDELPAFLSAAQADPAALSIGCRDMAGAPGSSQFGRNFSNFWVWAETGHRVGDSQSGYRVYPVQPTLSLGLRSSRYEWEVEVIVRALWAGIAVRDVPCTVVYPDDPEDSQSSFRPFLDNTRISLLNTRLVLGRVFWPPRWLNPVTPPGGTWRGDHLGTLWGWSFFLTWLRLFGRWPTYAAMSVMATVYLVVSGRHRQAVGTFLGRARPEAGSLARLWMSWRLFFGFACSLVDRFLLLVKGPRAFQITHQGCEEAQSTVASGEGALFLTIHSGNSDLGATALAMHADPSVHTPVNVVQYTHPGDPYPILVQRLAGEHAPRIISLNEEGTMAGLEAVHALRRGEIVALKGDRPVDGHRARVPFLGGTIEIPTGPFLLAATSRAPLFLLACFKTGPSSYTVYSSPAWRLRFTSRSERQADLQRWAEDFASHLEGWMRQYPLQWYNFYDPWEEAEER